MVLGRLSTFIVALGTANTVLAQTEAPIPSVLDSSTQIQITDLGKTAESDEKLPTGVRLAQNPAAENRAATEPSPANRSVPSTTNPPNTQNNGAAPASQNSNSSELNSSLFGSRGSLEALEEGRRRRARLSGADVVLGKEAFGKTAVKSDDLLHRSHSTSGVHAQKRTPMSTEVRVRGQRQGQLLASGSYWFPARADLDTMMDKIDSRIVQDMIVIKGPYSSRYGPGFGFVDIEMIKTPRFENGYNWDGSTSMIYKTNGDQWFGRQSVSGGSSNWGYQISYGHSTGVDYKDGNGIRIPSGFKSRDIYAAIGADISSTQRLEFSYIRLDQTDIEHPGLVFDIDYLVTDGFELIYEDSCSFIADEFVAEAWHNRTHFFGDSQGPGKALRIPALGVVAETDVDAASTGARFEWTLFGNQHDELTFGADVIHLDQELNDREPLDPLRDNNFPIPSSYSNDVGLFAEYIRQLTPRLDINVGGRIDFVNTHSVDVVRGVPFSISSALGPLDQTFFLGSAFLTSTYDIDEHWNLHSGAGYSERAPTLTEMYATAPFIGTLQRGLTFVSGDPTLRPERLFQVDLGIDAEFEDAQFGARAFHAWIRDYIAYDLYTPSTIDGLPNGVQYLNTDLATIAGVETYGDFRLTNMLHAFGNMSFLEGRDRSRDAASRFAFSPSRSNVNNRNHEPLPGIPPLQANVGIRVSDPECDLWGFEFSARIVDNQDRVALSLQEGVTPGFTTFDIRSYMRLRDNWLFTAGVENLTDKFYREHLDYRTGLGVFRSGISSYFGSEISY